MWTIGSESAQWIDSVCTAAGIDPGMGHATLKLGLTVVVGLGVWTYHSTRRWYDAKTALRSDRSASRLDEEPVVPHV